MSEYTCAACRKTYLKTWSDDDALKEYKERFGSMDMAPGLVCDECYTEMLVSFGHCDRCLELQCKCPVIVVIESYD